MMPEIVEKIKKYAAGLPPHTPEMDEHMERLRVICANPVVEAAFNEGIAHVNPYTETGEENPWGDASIQHFILYFDAWFTDLPQPTGGFGFILPFTRMYYNNPAAYFFLNELKSSSGGGRRGNHHDDKELTKEVFEWTKEFIMIRGKFMDSPASAPKDLLNAWINDPSTHIEDFKVPHRGFKSFNEFFTRELNPKGDPRPISKPDDDSIVVASADTVINLILSDLLLKSNINVKGRQISMEKLLDGSRLAEHFVGGTAVSCVLMPNVYHHYHSPVAGTIVESKDIPGVYNGIIDGEHWFNDMSNLGQGNTDFSIFEDFHRAYYIYKTEKYGHVAQVPVGLNTISRISPSLQGDSKYYVKPGHKGVRVHKGTRMGNFAYGGSLNILMFEKGVFPCISLQQGDRLGQMTPLKKD